MQLELAFVYLAIWLAMLWLGGVALEATGMERSKAHFQALSALSGTGFTTRDAESVVNHSTRRWIVTWLMFFGNAGFITLLILVIISVQTNWSAMPPGRYVIIGLLILASALFIWLGMVDKVATRLVRWMRKSRWFKHDITDWDLLHREGEYGIFRFAMHQVHHGEQTILGDSLFWKPSIGVLAIERNEGVIPFPRADQLLLPGDNLLCYGKVKEILGLTGNSIPSHLKD